MQDKGEDNSNQQRPLTAILSRDPQRGPLLVVATAAVAPALVPKIAMVRLWRLQLGYAIVHKLYFTLLIYSKLKLV